MPEYFLLGAYRVPSTENSKLAFVFVCQKGKLEVMAVLLACSIRCCSGEKYELIAAIPTPFDAYGQISMETEEALKSLGVRIAYINNPISREYPIGNKINCLSIATDADILIFLDSDMLMLRDIKPFEVEELKVGIGAVSATKAHCSEKVWKQLYSLCGLPTPESRVLTPDCKHSMLPYFNAGFIAKDRSVSLAKIWGETAEYLDGEISVPFKIKRPHLDQMSLPISAGKLGMDISAIDKKWNYPSWLMKIDNGDLPVFYHYLSIEYLVKEDVTYTFVRHLLSNEEIRNLIMGKKKYFYLNTGWGFNKCTWNSMRLYRVIKSGVQKILSFRLLEGCFSR